MRQLMGRMSIQAQAVGVRNLATLFKDYIETVSGTVTPGFNRTDFTGQEMELDCGGWTATDTGIYGTDKMGFEVVACYHPIMPVQRLVNVDTREHKVMLAYRLSRRWDIVIVDRNVISDSRSIIGLSKYGIMVNSETGKALVRYLADVEQLNYDLIPEVSSVGRLGWIEEYGFSPYEEELVFDGEETYRTRFESIQEHGSREAWLDCARAVRSGKTPGNVIARIVLAASFASVLVGPCRCLPFFVHLWGGSETGKSLSLVLAASVWANPEIGVYIQTFNATEVGKELGAAFCNSLPLIIDELQLVKDNRKDFDRMIYQLSEGVGRARGRKQGGLQKTPTWRNCVITTGEFPIISANSGEGAVNRTIEVDCHDTKLFDEPKKTATSLYANYGFAGREFVDHLMADGVIERVQKLQEDLQKAIKTGDTMDKQTASAALILAADRLSEEWIFQDGVLLQPDDIRPYLVSKETVNQNARALQYLYDFININQSRFSPGADAHQGEVWGDLDDDYAYIIRSKFDQILQDEGYNASAFLGWAKNNNLILPGKDGKMTRTKRINGRVSRCIWLKMDNYLNDFEENVEELLP
nr:MAG TPA: active helicase ring shaped helicase [Caudoviricetes sp.]